ncbi:GTPase-activator protein for Ras family GTPase [Entamoeba histolytica HM-1:IMSS-B]|uniref:Ras-GAP domain-containing protein n=6 Tax=Entamoeba histolytica TaxID=5759 RepID=C4LYA5_ENTH1|nr:hypothetical protein EHI_167030 [Entamoeba histolytica HM-1:IMSS]EMD47250.1 gtpaseactivator protein for Ras family gtpase [Entamoeba histolytica KU27]EMH77998.1 GTPase-activator protein for Ras family GTPase [Entamoeba histolytica HM-1:IMSS-B]EMS17521.1 GTPase-activator protein for Ras family GTPase [Entamoeba histolytica HM-3:IMSS]ENY65274.1 GTPase-activator protein for Ras family GTPase, putative [Entamoeba histolytica HM-1:IMSS-A]GAT93790.1 hypothetical protein CL6EHI_167030 [Entamoeba h|eukprot:XP_654787.1 hypothetical protein EHI_167030 [Entamoeba histolytica HM-1:IMSS]
MSVSEDTSYSFTEKLEFDEMLFSNNHVLLEALSQTLIYRNVSKSGSNASLILQYYYAHGKVLELLLWMFEKELTENPPETKYFPLQSRLSLFITFYNEYSKLFLIDYLKHVLTPVLDLIVNSTLNISVFQGTNNETNEDETKQTTDNFKHSLDLLIQIIDLLNKNILKEIEYLPPHFNILMQKIINRLIPYNNVTNGFMSILLFQITIAPILDNPSIICYSIEKNIYLSNIHKFSFVKETINGIHQLTKENTFAYIYAIKQRLNDPTSELIKQLINENLYEEQPQTLSKQNSLHKELIKMIKENIQLVIDSLPPRVSDKLLNIINVEHYVLDDYHIFHSVIESINKYCLYYNRQMEHNIKASIEQRRLLQQIQNEYQSYECQLQNKRTKNQQLLNTLNSILQKKGLPTVTRVLPELKINEKPKKEVECLLPSVKEEVPKKRGRTRKASLYEIVMGRKGKKERKDN